MVTTITNSGLANSSTIESSGAIVVVSGFGTWRTKDSKDTFISNGINNLKIVDSSNRIKQNGFSSFKVVPAVVNGSFDERFNEAFDEVSSTVINTLASVQQDANNIKSTVLNMSNNLTTNYLSKAELTSYENITNITSAIKEQTATFVTAEQAGGWYGLTLESDVNGKKYITGFDIGSIVYPESGINDSYFRINADKFIVGGDIGDGSFGGPLDKNGEPLPAFSIVQDSIGSPQIYFNGKVNISSIPEKFNKLIGTFAHISELNSYLAMNPEIGVTTGDTYIDSTDSTVYTWDGSAWITLSVELFRFAIIFKRSKTVPTTPTGGNYIDPTGGNEGWSDGIPAINAGVDAQDPIYWSSATLSSKVNYTLTPPEWSVPVIAADSPTTDYMYNDSISKPADPTNISDLTSVSSTDATNGWYNTASENAMWAAYRSKSAGVWSSWGVWKVKGEDGVDGAQGARGSTIARIYSTSNNIQYYKDNTSLLTSAIYNIVTPNVLQKGDQVIVTASNGTEIFEYNGSVWGSNTALKVNGNAIIDGTLTADKLASNISLTTNGYIVANGNYSGSWGTTAIAGNTSYTAPIGVWGGSAAFNQAGVMGVNNTSGANSCGVLGTSTGGKGVRGLSVIGTGLYGYSNTGTAIYGQSSSSYAGYFAGPVAVTGSLSVSGSNISGNTITGSYINSSGNITGSGYCSINGYINTNTEFRKSGAFLAFTGGHITYSDSDIMLGDIIYVDSVIHANIAQTFQKVYSTTTPMDKRVFGIAAVSCSDTEGLELVEFWCKDPETGEFRDDGFEDFYNSIFGDTWYSIYKTNSIGEGQMNVCAVNGDIANGDYICSSAVRGKGMKQDDDILHSYTVAKALENVVWDDEIVGEGGCFEQDGYKCKMIACTYHSG